MLLRVAAATAVVLALTACGGPKQQAAPHSDLPPGCSVEQVGTIVSSFLARPTVAQHCLAVIAAPATAWLLQMTGSPKLLVYRECEQPEPLESQVNLADVGKPVVCPGIV